MQFVLSLVCVFLIVPLIAQPIEAEVESSSIPGVETIDPFQKHRGDFLDIELNKYRKIAYESYYAKNYERAAQYYLAALQYNIEDINSIYNLACCYALLGKDSLAALYLRRAFVAGYSDIVSLKRDPDFDKVKSKPVFAALLDSITAILKSPSNAVYVEAPGLHKCLVYLPEDYSSMKTYPLVIGLHGNRSNSERFARFSDIFVRNGFIYAAPQAPFEAEGFVGAYSWRFPGPQDQYTVKSTRISEDYIADVVRDLTIRYNVSDIYLMGLSLGGAFSYMAGIKHHKLFKGLVCFAAWLDTNWIADESIAQAKHLRVFICHGQSDDVIFFERGLKAKEKLEQNGYTVTFRAHDRGHMLPEDILPEVVEWMKQ